MGVKANFSGFCHANRFMANAVAKQFDKSSLERACGGAGF